MSGILLSLRNLFADYDQGKFEREFKKIFGAIAKEQGVDVPEELENFSGARVDRLYIPCDRWKMGDALNQHFRVVVEGEDPDTQAMKIKVIPKGKTVLKLENLGN